MINFYSYKKLQFQKKLAIMRLKLSKSVFSTTLIGLFLLILVIYNQFFDAFQTLAPGHADTYNHIQFIKSIDEQGYNLSTWYAPGFHILVYPLVKVLPYSDIYRFTGPVLSIFSLVGIYLLFRDLLKNKTSHVLFIALFLFPIFNQLSLQLMSFFSSSLTFLIFTTMICIACQKIREVNIKYLVIFGLLTAMTSVTVPYFFVSLIPAFFSLLITSILIKSQKKMLYAKFAVILIAGLVLSFLSVLLQTSVHSGEPYFPNIPIVSNNTGTLIITSNKTVSCEKYQLICAVEKMIKQINPKFSSTIVPLLRSGYDLIKFKQLRPINSYLSVGAYIWIVAAVFFVRLGIKRRDHVLLLIGIFSVLFGLYTQTGIFELSSYRGRSGWYLLLLCLIGMVLIYDRFPKRFISKCTPIIIVVICMIGIMSPPQFYRAYYTEHLIQLKNLAVTNPGPITVLTESPNDSLVNDNLIFKKLDLETLDEVSLPEDSIIILEKHELQIDPVKSQKSHTIDKDYKVFNDIINQKAINQSLLNDRVHKYFGCTSKNAVIETTNILICRT